MYMPLGKMLPRYHAHAIDNVSMNRQYLLVSRPVWLEEATFNTTSMPHRRKAACSPTVLGMFVIEEPASKKLLY